MNARTDNRFLAHPTRAAGIKARRWPTRNPMGQLTYCANEVKSAVYRVDAGNRRQKMLIAFLSSDMKHPRIQQWPMISPRLPVTV
jgi:hypothetical protein